MTNPGLLIARSLTMGHGGITSVPKSNLNGPYLAGQQHNETSIQWHSWKAFYSLKKTTMMITRI